MTRIRDLRLAPEGHRRMAWASRHMPLLTELRARADAGARPLSGLRIGICLHLEAKTAVLASTLKTLGADVHIAGSNPLSTQDAVAAALSETGVQVYAWHGASAAEYHQFVGDVVQAQPDLIIDDGGDLVAALHEREDAQRVRGGAEETTTGIARLRALRDSGRLELPMIAVNDTPMKHLFDNRFGTGQSVWDAIMRTTNVTIAGREVVVVGYGYCGRGVALRARGLGARVKIVEIDAVKANEAWLDGFDVCNLEEAAPRGDIFVTVTGNLHVLRKEHFMVMKDGAMLANAGHFDVEVNIDDLRSLCGAPKTVRTGIEAYARPDGANLFLLAEGRLVNLAAGDGHPIEIMDLSFALQALVLCDLATQERLAPGLYDVPAAIDAEVAKLSLAARGLHLETLTSEQERYLCAYDAAPAR